MSVITIVGAGMMGSAMSFPAKANGHEVRLVGTPLDAEIIRHAKETGYHITLKRQLPEGLKYYFIDELSTALKGADIVVGGVSSFGVDWFAENVLPAIPSDVPLLSITKGMMNTPEGKLVPYPYIYKEKLNGRKLSLNAVGGPCTSYELADRDPTEVCFCGEDPDILRALRVEFSTEFYNISISTDVVGVECAVAMKNAYALGVSLAVGLSERIESIGGKEHYNSQAALFGQSVKELRRLLKIVGGGDDNIVFGAGDLYVTVFGGRTRKVGTLLGRGVSFDDAMKELNGITLESVVIAKRTVAAIKTLIEKDEAKTEDFPLLLHIGEIINEGKPVNIPWKSFTSESV